MSVAKVHVEMRRGIRSHRLKKTVLAAFWEPAPSIRARLGEFSARDWERAMFWLAVSGLALYFLDRLTTLGLEECLPPTVLARLRQNLADNRERTAWLFEEAITLNRELQQLEIPFAFLKGITLTPESVPDATYRCQTDLDLLIRESDSEPVYAVLEKLGYGLHASSGQTREFKAGPFGTATVHDIYKARRDRSLDLHLLAGTSNGARVMEDRLTRARLRSIQGAILPALSPPDIFVQQAFHLFKHMCSEHTRAFWVLEFWRHVIARRDDLAFWESVRLIAASEPQAELAIGVATMLASLIFGPFAPSQLTSWSMDRLSPAICLWIQLYGRQILLSDSPHSKLYLLLREQLDSDPSGVSVARKRLIFPIHLPPRVTRGESGESILTRLGRYRMQAKFALIRLWFHLAEGLRFAVESLRWQRRLMGVTQ